MPSEIRQLVFSNAEISRALEEFNRRCGETLPSGVIASVSEEAPSCEDITFEFGAGLSVAKVNRIKLAAALILFCKQQKVPLPIGAEKTLSVARGMLVLTVKMSDATRRQGLKAVSERALPPAARAV